MTDWTSIGLALAAIAGTLVLALITWWQFREQRRQFDSEFEEQKRQFSEQIAADREKIIRLEALFAESQKQTKAQEEQTRLTGEQNALLAKDVALREEKLQRDKEPLGKKIWRGIFGG